ncbi:hypothetical protein DBZ36_03885 [Alginatibacterium sediminis]|uniref:FlgO domain-containing protein n=1 Tax=Alginatibacterium sediminis TaxID=2164068 RepID=A0A420EFY3_9ALTE|nr:FlgO family outer membrane protein [Alginatibacterium sediminis]RKF19615.1 hypothetical protein DBZ36_03885 [Alginatibacterium sediminis]
MSVYFKRQVGLSAAILLLSACSATSSNSNSNSAQAQRAPAAHRLPGNTGAPIPQAASMESLSDYVAQLSYRLVSSSHYVSQSTPLAVASFVELQNLKATSLFGLQIEESMLSQLQHYGFSVIDYKATGFMRITPEGDFVFSRDVKELPRRHPIEYYVSGTYSRSKEGIIVNARIIGVESKVIVASAEQLIPHHVYYSSVPKVSPKRTSELLVQNRK